MARVASTTLLFEAVAPTSPRASTLLTTSAANVYSHIVATIERGSDAEAPPPGTCSQRPVRRSVQMRPFAAALLCTMTWLCFAGPPSEWRSVGIGGGGALFAPSFSPHNPDEMYLACDMGEVFHTTDLGRHWTTIHFRRLQAWTYSPKVQFTSDPLVLYAVDSTGERETPVRSDDGGLTWRPLAGDPTKKRARYMVGDDTRTDRILLCDTTTLYVSRDGGASFSTAYRASSNGGLHLAGAFFDGDLVLAATSDGLIVSEDGGTTFSRRETIGIPSDEAIVSFSGAKADNVIRFFCVTLQRDAVRPGVTGSRYGESRGVYSLDWGVPHWRRLGEGISRDDRPVFVDMAHSDVRSAYLGGCNNGVPVILKTSDGGATWQSVFRARGNENVTTGWCGSGGDRDWGYGEYVLGLDVHPSDPDRVAFTDLGFIHLTIDGGRNWRQAYVGQTAEHPPGKPTPRRCTYEGVGLENTSCWWLAWADRDTIWASFSDIRGIRSTDRGRSWAFDYVGHSLNSSYQVVVSDSGHLYMATSSVHDLYQSTHLTDDRIDRGKGEVLASADGGRTWRRVGSLGDPVVGLALDPGNPRRLLASVVHSVRGGIYVCDDASCGEQAQWRRLPPPPRTEGHPLSVAVLRDGSIVCSYSGRRAGQPRKFTPSSGVFLTSNDGQTWEDRSDANMRYWTMDLVIDPHDPAQDTWYAAVYSGWGGEANGKGGLYRTRDRGRTWHRIFGAVRVSSCTVHPANADEMYVTTERDGLWYTADLRAERPTFSPVESYPFRQPMRVFFNPYDPEEIWVTSFGNGIRVGRAAPADAGKRPAP